MYDQQGDVLIKKIDSLPKGNYKKITTKKIVLAEGEQTGHSHVLFSDLLNFMVFTDEVTNQSFVEVPDGTNVTHQEHNQFEETILPGMYKIEIVREYDHFTEETRRVID